MAVNLPILRVRDENGNEYPIPAVGLVGPKGEPGPAGLPGKDAAEIPWELLYDQVVDVPVWTQYIELTIPPMTQKRELFFIQKDFAPVYEEGHDTLGNFEFVFDAQLKKYGFGAAIRNAVTMSQSQPWTKDKSYSWYVSAMTKTLGYAVSANTGLNVQVDQSSDVKFGTCKVFAPTTMQQIFSNKGYRGSFRLQVYGRGAV